MFVDSPHRSWRIFAGVVFSPKRGRHGLDHKDKHLGITAGGHAGEKEKNGKDHDGAQETTQQHLKACAGKQGSREQCALHSHNRQWLVQRLVDRIRESGDRRDVFQSKLNRTDGPLS